MLARSRWVDIGWVLFTNLFLLAGVVAWGWPPGNVFLLFWIENVILGVVTTTRILTAQDAETAGTAQQTPRWARAGFFALHYGIFAVVHGVFVGLIAVRIGVSISWWALGLPALLIALRYTADLATVWFLGEQRRSVTATQAFLWPYPRLMVLHFATVLGFGFAMPFGSTGGGFLGRFLAPLQDAFAAFGLTLSPGAALVALLMVLKTIADVALVVGRGRPSSRVRFSFGTTG